MPSLVEFGSGSATKTRLLIEATLEGVSALRYVPIDISSTVLDESSREILATYPAVSVTAIAAEYEDGLAKIARDTTIAPSPRLVLWLGSNVGNLHRDEAARFLGRVSGFLGPDDRMLIGVDLRKDKATLEAAYDDAAGVTGRFNLNLLARINRELGGHFDLDRFAHRAIYDESAGRIEMYLVSRCDQQVTIDALGGAVALREGEAIHTENSYKYSTDELDRLADASGFSTVGRWFDSGRRFSLSLLASK